MKYIIGYIPMEAKLINENMLDFDLVGDFIPLEPNLIFNNIKQAKQKVKELKTEEKIKNFGYLFIKPGNIVKNFCYDEIDE